MTPVIGFIGMTHLGLVSATAYADKGFQVYCFDQDETLIENLKNGNLPVLEPGLDDLVAQNGTRQQFTCDFTQLSQCDVVYIAPDVPTDDQGQSDLSDITALIDTVVPNLNKAAHLVVLCQVPPGFTNQITFPKDRLYYQVETLIFGCAVDRARYPERYIIGCDKPEKGVQDPFKSVLDAFDCPILPMRYESAELAKISINMCLVSSISVANTMAELCEHIGADWSEIVPALKLDERIGPFAYLKPGLGIAGGNLERDLATVIQFSNTHGTDSGVVQSWLHNSRHRRDWAAKELTKVLATPALSNVKIAVWGLAYKENTHSIKNSPSLATLRQFPNNHFVAFDPQVKGEDLPDPHIIDAASELDAAKDSEILLILTPWPQFKDISLNDLCDTMQGVKLIFDPYRVFSPQDAKAAGLDYRTLGAVY